MKNPKSYVAIGVCVLILALLLSIPLNSRTAGSSRFAYGTRNLIGASADEVAQFAIQYAENNERVNGVTPQVLLSRSIQNEGLPALGFDCIIFGTIERPPLMLVVMKGKFFIGGGMGGVGRDYSYLAYIFDVWSATPTFRSASLDGSDMRLALNNPSLPTPNPKFERPPVCPTPAPTNLHYGDTVPAASAPSSIPSDTSPTPNTTIPAAITTYTK